MADFVFFSCDIQYLKTMKCDKGKKGVHRKVSREWKKAAAAIGARFRTFEVELWRSCRYVNNSSI